MQGLCMRGGRVSSAIPAARGKIGLCAVAWHGTFAGMRHAARILAAAFLLLAAGITQALEIKDIRTDMTRVQADMELTKDYKYRVLQDMAVRRTWMVGEQCRVSLDFNTGNGKLVFVLVEYKGGVDRDRVDDDTETILGDSDIKWKKLAKNKQDKYGVKNARVAKANNGFYIFQEYNKKKKCVRLMMTAAHPEENRRKMQDASDSNRVTALGSTAGGSVVHQIRQEEERRLRQPNKTTRVAPEPKVENPAPAVKKPARPMPDEPLDDDEDDEMDDSPGGGLVSEKVSVMDWLADHGVGEERLIQIGAGVVGLVILFSLIGYARRRAARKRILQHVQELNRQAAEEDEEDEEDEEK